MKNYPRHRATTPKTIFKESHEEVIKYGKRKYTHEFFVFWYEVFGWYSVSSADICGDAIEHWVKDNGRWHKEAYTDRRESALT